MKKVMLAVMVLSAVVNGAYANGTNNLVGGTDNVATSNSAAVFGYKNTVNSNNAIAFGENNTVNGTNSFAGGNNSKAEGRNSFAFGSHAEALVEYTTAIGSQARTSASNTVAIGNGVVTNGESSVAIGYGVTTDSTNAIAIGNEDSVASDESIAIGHGAKADTVIGTSSYVINGETHTFAGTTPIGTVSVGDANKERTITNVAAGRISNNSTDTINGSQLYEVISELETTDGKVTTLKERVDRHDQRIGYLQDNIADQSARISAVEGDVKTNATNIANNTKTINDHSKVLVDHEQRITTLESDNKELKNDVQNTQNQVNINTKDIADLKGKVGNVAAINNELNNKVNNLGQRVNKLGASSAALAGLHPMEFNKDDKFSTSVAYGHYKNANAVALGAYYRPNEKVLLGIAGTFGSENMYNVSASFKFGKHSEYEPQAKRDGEIESMKAQIAELTARLDAVSK